MPNALLKGTIRSSCTRRIETGVIRLFFASFRLLWKRLNNKWNFLDDRRLYKNTVHLFTKGLNVRREGDKNDSITDHML